MQGGFEVARLGLGVNFVWRKRQGSGVFCKAGRTMINARLSGHE